MLKFHFSIQTREGHKLNSVITIAGRGQEHAEAELRQMYRYCEILRCDLEQGDEQRAHANSLEDIVTLIAK